MAGLTPLLNLTQPVSKLYFPRALLLTTCEPPQRPARGCYVVVQNDWNSMRTEPRSITEPNRTAMPMAFMLGNKWTLDVRHSPHEQLAHECDTRWEDFGVYLHTGRASQDHIGHFTVTVWAMFDLADALAERHIATNHSRHEGHCSGKIIWQMTKFGTLPPDGWPSQVLKAFLHAAFDGLCGSDRLKHFDRVASTRRQPVCFRHLLISHSRVDRFPRPSQAASLRAALSLPTPHMHGAPTPVELMRVLLVQRDPPRTFGPLDRIIPMLRNHSDLLNIYLDGALAKLPVMEQLRVVSRSNVFVGREGSHTSNWIAAPPGAVNIQISDCGSDLGGGIWELPAFLGMHHMKLLTTHSFQNDYLERRYCGTVLRSREVNTSAFWCAQMRSEKRQLQCDKDFESWVEHEQAGGNCSTRKKVYAGWPPCIYDLHVTLEPQQLEALMGLLVQAKELVAGARSAL